MIVNSTDLKNNLGKYLRLSTGENIIITSNRRKIAVLSAYKKIGNASANIGRVNEQAEIYGIYTPKSFL